MAKADRGFASMSRAKQREIASSGGRAAHMNGTAHQWTAEEARAAGHKGGTATHVNRVKAAAAARERETATETPAATETADETRA